jgi:hypothetical protein
MEFHTAENTSSLIMDFARDCATCSLCQTAVVDPRVLRCLHSFCLTCLMANCSTPNVRCPRCLFMTVIPTMDQLPKNYAVVDFLRRQRGAKSCQNCEVRKAEAYCVQCSSGLCGDCNSHIHRNAIFRGHSVIQLWQDADTTLAITSAGKVPTGAAPALLPTVIDLSVCCSKHPQELLQLFCRTCRFSICKLCAVDIHRSHKIVSCEEEVPSILQSIPLLLQELSRVHAKCNTITERVAQARSEVEDFYQRSINTVEDTMTKYLQQLQSRRVALLSALQEEYVTKVKLLDEQDGTLREIMACSRHAHCVAMTLTPEKCGVSVADSDDDDENAGDVHRDLKSARVRLPCNTTPSVLCDIGCGVSDVVAYSLGQRLDSTACVDTNISVSFSRLEELFYSTVTALGDIHVLRSRGRMFPYSGDPETNDGVLAYLGCDRGIKIYQNPVHRGLVRVSASGMGYGRLENFVSSERSEFCTTEPGTKDGLSSVTVVLDAPVVVSHYRLGHDTYDATGHFLRSWLLQGRNTTGSSSQRNDAASSDDGGWITLDARTNDASLSMKTPLRVFETSKFVTEERIGCNELRLVQTGQNSDNSQHLMASAFEVFGELMGL